MFKVAGLIAIDVLFSFVFQASKQHISCGLFMKASSTISITCLSEMMHY